MIKFKHTNNTVFDSNKKILINACCLYKSVNMLFPLFVQNNSSFSMKATDECELNDIQRMEFVYNCGS